MLRGPMFCSVCL